MSYNEQWLRDVSYDEQWFRFLRATAMDEPWGFPLSLLAAKFEKAA